MNILYDERVDVVLPDVDRAALLQALHEQWPALEVLHQQEELRPYECDGLSAYRTTPLLVVLPRHIEEVQGVLRLCHERRVPVVARGAGTGLSADGVLHKHRTLDDQLDGAGAHPGLKSLADRDRALMRRLVSTILRKLGTLGHLLSRLLDRGIPTDAPRAQSALLIGAAQILWMDVPDHAAVDLSVRLVQSDRRAAKYAGLVNAVLRRFLRERQNLLDTASLQPLARWNYPQWWIDAVRAAWAWWRLPVPPGATWISPPCWSRMNPWNGWATARRSWPWPLRCTAPGSRPPSPPAGAWSAPPIAGCGPKTAARSSGLRYGSTAWSAVCAPRQAGRRGNMWWSATAVGRGCVA